MVEADVELRDRLTQCRHRLQLAREWYLPRPMRQFLGRWLLRGSEALGGNARRASRAGNCSDSVTIQRLHRLRQRIASLPSTEPAWDGQVAEPLRERRHPRPNEALTRPFRHRSAAPVNPHRLRWVSWHGSDSKSPVSGAVPLVWFHDVASVLGRRVLWLPVDPPPHLLILASAEPCATEEWVGWLLETVHWLTEGIVMQCSAVSSSPLRQPCRFWGWIRWPRLAEHVAISPCLTVPIQWFGLPDSPFTAGSHLRRSEAFPKWCAAGCDDGGQSWRVLDLPSSSSDTDPPLLWVHLPHGPGQSCQWRPLHDGQPESGKHNGLADLLDPEPHPGDSVCSVQNGHGSVVYLSGDQLFWATPDSMSQFGGQWTQQVQVPWTLDQRVVRLEFACIPKHAWRLICRTSSPSRVHGPHFWREHPVPIVLVAADRRSQSAYVRILFRGSLIALPSISIASKDKYDLVQTS